MDREAHRFSAGPHLLREGPPGVKDHPRGVHPLAPHHRDQRPPTIVDEQPVVLDGGLIEQREVLATTERAREGIAFVVPGLASRLGG